MLPVRAINVVHKLHLENKNKELPKKNLMPVQKRRY
jgi:hypothetical protein